MRRRANTSASLKWPEGRGAQFSVTQAEGLGVVVGLVLMFVAIGAHVRGRRETGGGVRMKGWDPSSNYHKLKDTTVWFRGGR